MASVVVEDKLLIIGGCNLFKQEYYTGVWLLDVSAIDNITGNKNGGKIKFICM